MCCCRSLIVFYNQCEVLLVLSFNVMKIMCSFFLLKSRHARYSVIDIEHQNCCSNVLLAENASAYAYLAPVEELRAYVFMNAEIYSST